VEIPHLVRNGRFRPIIEAAIEANACPGSLRVDLPLGGGYRGDIEVSIGPATKKAFEADVSLLPFGLVHGLWQRPLNLSADVWVSLR
jgi:hypothetical protein